MPRLAAVFAALLLAPAAAFGQAPPAPALAVTRGEVVSATKDAVVVKPRGADGRFDKEVTLRVTGTTKVAAVAVPPRAGKLTPVQTDADPKELQAKQPIAAVYLDLPGGPVLLSAVAQPAPGK